MCMGIEISCDLEIAGAEEQFKKMNISFEIRAILLALLDVHNVRWLLRKVRSRTNYFPNNQLMVSE